MILYALLAVLLWPASRPGASPPFVAAGAVGQRAARALWLVLWLSLAYFALTPANRAPGALSGALTDAGDGEPGWLAGLGKGAASLVAGRGLAAAVILAVAFVLIAAGVFLPRAGARVAVVLAIVVAALIWVIGQAFGMILATGATDPNSGPLLILLALAYWPVAAPARASSRASRAGDPGASGSARMTPAWLLDAVAALMLVVAAMSAARLARGRVIDTDLAHLLMAVAMAGMLAPSLRTLPDVPWEIIFGLLAAWFAVRVAGDARANGVRALAGGHCAHRISCTAARCSTCSLP